MGAAAPSTERKKGFLKGKKIQKLIEKMKVRHTHRYSETYTFRIYLILPCFWCQHPAIQNGRTERMIWSMKLFSSTKKWGSFHKRSQKV